MDLMMIILPLLALILLWIDQYCKQDFKVIYIENAENGCLDYLEFNYF